MQLFLLADINAEYLAIEIYVSRSICIDDIVASCPVQCGSKSPVARGNVPLCSLQRLLPACLDKRNAGVLNVMNAIVPLATTLEVPGACPSKQVHGLLTALMLMPGGQQQPPQHLLA